MRAVIQKVSKAKCVVNNAEISSINDGFAIFLAIKDTDKQEDIDYIVKKIENLRIFEDENGKMNISLKDKGYQILLISQFTLYGDVRKGNRPSFVSSAKPDKAEEYIKIVENKLKQDGFDVRSGKFRSHMEISLTNDGPVTIILDSEKIL